MISKCRNIAYLWFKIIADRHPRILHEHYAHNTINPKIYVVAMVLFITVHNKTSISII